MTREELMLWSDVLPDLKTKIISLKHEIEEKKVFIMSVKEKIRRSKMDNDSKMFQVDIVDWLAVKSVGNKKRPALEDLEAELKRIIRKTDLIEDKESFLKVDISELKERVDIIEIADEDLEINTVGLKGYACCPFHKEKTPSFVLYSDTNRYKCYGCGERGDVVDFIMKVRKKTFREVINILYKYV